MLKELIQYLENKKIVILGFGIEGESSYKFLRKYFPEKKLYIADKNEDLIKQHQYLEKDSNLIVSLGEDYLKEIEYFDLILKAPGISLKNISIANFQEKITSQLELFLEFLEVYTIGITGTKGKSTTSTLMYQILKEQGKDTFLLGNIGKPIWNEIENINNNSIVILELSSHALEYIKKSTNIAILLNIYEEHLDHYESLENYIKAKYNIKKYQNDKDYFIYNYDNEIMKKYNYLCDINDYAISLQPIQDKSLNTVFLKENNIYYNNQFLVNADFKMNLQGTHIINNIMFIFAVCNILHLDLKKALKTIEEFKPLEHRMEFVGEFNKISFYNDSIATIPEATINSIKSIPNVNTIIIGGKDRGVNLEELIKFLSISVIENIICLPKTGEYIFEKLKNSNKKLFLVQDLKTAVNLAKDITKPNTSCLLSPAASSYGYFKNFEERGKLYKKYIKEN